MPKLKCYMKEGTRSAFKVFLFKEDDELTTEILNAAWEAAHTPGCSAAQMETAVRKIVPDANVEAKLNDYGVAWQIKVT